jgi:hypothetical protein
MPIWRNGAGTGLWGTPGNWDTGAIPTAATDAIFDNLSPNCTVNITTAVCRNLNFNSGTGYTNTITMTNNITVGATSGATPNHSVILSAGMGIAGAGWLLTRANGTTTLTSNGRTWPNALFINAVLVANNSVATITGDWTVAALVLGPGANHAMTLNGAFTITVLGNFVVNPAGNVSRVIATAGSLTTIKLAGTGTWSTNTTFTSTATAAIGFGPSIVIDTPGTITIANGCYFGGSVSVAGTNFTYVTGTVIHSGTFHLLGNQGGNGYSVNLNGSSSPSATTTSSTGVNFQNLSFTTFSVGASPGACAITGNLCAVGNLLVTAFSAVKGMVLTTGGTIYVGGNLTIVGAMRVASSTVVVLQGTGTWTENTITLGVGFGISWKVQINTTGTINVGSNVGLTDGGSVTYTAGTFTWGAGNTLYMTSASALYGLGSYGIIIDNLIHVSNAATGNAGAVIYFYDTVPVKFGSISLTGSVANNAWQQLGTIGWICNSLSCFLNASTGNTGLRLTPGAEYTVNTSLIMLAWSSANNFGVAPNSFGTVKFTLAYGAYQDLYYLNSGNNVSLIVDSSDGQTIWTRGGSLLGSINWKNWDYPRTRHSTFVSN